MPSALLVHECQSLVGEIFTVRGIKFQIIIADRNLNDTLIAFLKVKKIGSSSDPQPATADDHEHT